jgi:hypothetical protein
MPDAYLIGLCRDYVELVDLHRSGSDLTPEELHQIDQQRQVTHRQLCQYTGMGLDEDMYRYAKAVLHAARGSNYQ